MTRLHLLVLLVVACVCYSALPVNGEAIELTSDDFFTSVNSGTWFVKFYAPWCPHCKSLAPVWDELATKATDFKVAKVDCEAEPGVCQALSVKGFPTLFLFSGPKASKDNLDSRAQKYSGAREVDAFLAFVKDNVKASDGDDDEEDSSTVTKQDKKTDAPAAATTKSSSEAITDPVSVPAIDLTNANFSETKKGAWFVEFYAPWCGYCKKLAPVYSEFAILENAKGDFKVAKVNCDEEKAICGSVGVTAFPTLKFIVNGKTHDHVGAQTVKDMGTFARGVLEDSSAEASGSDVVVLTNNNFERKVMSSDGAWLIDFYAPWCGHCKDVAPIWEEFAKTTKDNGDDINVAKIDCDANEALCERFNVQGYPTIKLLQLRTFPASKTRDLAGFQKFWEKYEGVFTDPSASDVVILNADNFKQRTKHGLWLVDYYAPWCGHCKQLAPVLEEVATAQKGNFYVGKVDCEGPGNDRLCETITGYPTLVAFQDGKKLANFQNAERSAQVIVDWMESFEEEVSEEDEELTDVAVLTDENFKRRTSEGNWLIEFYAPWCGHCKQLAPLWEELAIIENPTERVRVAKIDCTRYSALCEKHKVDSFPAITFFKDGKEKKPRFSGERSLPKLREYIDKFVPRPADNFGSKDIL